MKSVVVLALGCMIWQTWPFGLPRAAADEAGEQKEGQFEAEIVIKVQMNYLLFLPENYDQKESWPLMVFLHGAGERGSDVDLLKKHGPPKMVESDKKFPFVVLSPQCARRDWWRPEAVLALVEKISSEHRIDKDRIYVTGLSMGGYGTWALAVAYPDKFAAIAPICGGGESDEAARIKHLPAWVFHGGKDMVVPAERSVEMVDALKAAGGDVKLTIYPDAGHDSWTETYANEELYKWLLSHRRSTPSP